MCKNTKIVNIYPSMPITTISPPIRTAIRRVTKSVEEIKLCILAKAIVEEVLANNPKSVEDYRAGKKQAMGFLVGQIMKASKGQANPAVVNKLLAERLEQ